MESTMRVNADHGRDFNPLAGHMTKLRYFTKGKIRVIFQQLKHFTKAENLHFSAF